jgi:hypothetical protein
VLAERADEPARRHQLHLVGEQQHADRRIRDGGGHGRVPRDGDEVPFGFEHGACPRKARDVVVHHEDDRGMRCGHGGHDQKQGDGPSSRRRETRRNLS